MNIIDILTSPWALLPEKYNEIIGIYERWAGGEKAEIAKIEASLGRPLKNEQKRYEIVDGVAVIPVEGVLAKRMNLCIEISGGASTQIIAQDFGLAMGDPSVEGVLFVIDSPGGEVSGTQDLAGAIFRAREQKPVYAIADGMMVSGAAWIGTAAERVFLVDGTTLTGSIGVVMVHRDFSKRAEQSGVKTTEIYAGEYKMIASDQKPLTDEGREYLQAIVDDMYSAFVGDVAKNRGTTAEDVLERMADGRLFVGAKAVEAGLVDGIATMGEVMVMIKEEAAQRKAGTYAPLTAKAAESGARNNDKAQRTNIHTQGGSIMGETTKVEITVESLKRNYPQVAEAIYNDGCAVGAKAERERIQGVEAQSMPGHEALIASLKFDGKTSGPEAAVQVINAERSKMGRMMDTIRTSAPDPAPLSVSAEQATVSANAPIEEMAKAEWDRDAKVRDDFNGNYETYLAFVKIKGFEWKE